MQQYVDTMQVIKSYLAANEAKEIYGKKFSDFNKIKFFKKQFNKINKLNLEELTKLVDDKHRLKRFMGHKWFVEEVRLKYAGGWPRIGDLDKDWCQGSVVDVAKQVVINKDDQGESLKKIFEILPIIDDVLELFPPVFVQGGEIRHEHNLLCLPFDADDGSHRCIAAVLSGKRKIKAYVGLM